jgi:Fur family transcriptional regulator, zinc uptake regulator
MALTIHAIMAPAMQNTEHDHQKCIKQAVDTAMRLCAKQGLKFTDIRRRVLEKIWGSHEAVKAYDLVELLNQEDHASKPVTVYRALDFLIENGLVHKIESLNAYVGCNQPLKHHQFTLLICTKCNRAQEIDSKPLNEVLRDTAEEHTFVIKSRTLELRGICSSCH